MEILAVTSVNVANFGKIRAEIHQALPTITFFLTVQLSSEK